MHVNNQAHIALGSNLGDRAQAIATAIEQLEATGACRVLRQSAVIETDPVGPPQPKYLNGAMLVETSLSAKELLHACLDIERQMGRDRSKDVRHGPRVIDLDLLFFGELIMDEPELTLPHPRLAERRFVLAPLCEIDPTFVHPRLGLAIKDLLERL